MQNITSGYKAFHPIKIEKNFRGIIKFIRGREIINII